MPSLIAGNDKCSTKSSAKQRKPLTIPVQSRIVRELAINIKEVDEPVHNPFANAREENKRIEEMMEQQRLKLKNFSLNLTKRLKEYKQLEETNINENLVQASSRKPCSNLESTRSNTSRSTGSTTTAASNAAMESGLTIKARFAEKCKKAEENMMKKRVETARKFYGQMERHQSRQTPASAVSTAKPRTNKLKPKSPRSTKKMDKSRVRIKKESNCQPIESSKVTRQPIRDQRPSLVDEQQESQRKRTEPKQFKSIIIKPMSREERYINYLRSILRERITQLKISDLPPLCQCSLMNYAEYQDSRKSLSRDEQAALNIINFNMSSCANNCLFYNNPKGIT